MRPRSRRPAASRTQPHTGRARPTTGSARSSRPRPRTLEQRLPPVERRVVADRVEERTEAPPVRGPRAVAQLNQSPAGDRGGVKTMGLRAFLFERAAKPLHRFELRL